MDVKGYIYAVISAVFFGSAGIFIKSGYSNNFSPVDLLMLQYIIAGFLLFLACIIKYKSKLILSRTMLKKLIIQGIIGNTLMTVFYYSSFKYLDVSITTMLLYTYPAMVALASFLLYRERISLKKILAIIGTFTGSVMVLNIFAGVSGTISLKGVGFGVLAAVFYAFMNIYAKSIVEEIPALVVTFYTTVFSLIILFIFNFGFIYKLPRITGAAVINAASLAFLCEIIPLTLLYEALRHIGPVPVSIVGTLELPAAAFFSYFVVGENLFFIQIVGIILIILSVAALKIPEKT